MLGSYQDAEDAVQDALFAAWSGIGGFEERSSIRTWLYRVIVITLSGERICGLTRFENRALAWFGLPRSLARARWRR